MKISVDIECTPEEARRFFGLPDVQPMHEVLVAELQERLRAGLQSMEPEALMRLWMPAGMQGLDQFQKFWSQFAAGGRKGSSS